MRTAVLGAVLVLIAGTLASGAAAEKPPRIPAWVDGQLVSFTVVNANVIGVTHPTPQAIPFYAFGEPENQPQLDVLSAEPGEPEYNPWWHVFLVVVLDGRNVGTNPFKSDTEILAAGAAGKVAIIDTGFVFLCQVLPGNNAP